MKKISLLKAQYANVLIPQSVQKSIKGGAFWVCYNTCRLPNGSLEVIILQACTNTGNRCNNAYPGATSVNCYCE
jgi:hypothetical protein